MLRDLEINVMAVQHAETCEELADAYTVMCFNRKEVYEYIEALERLAEINPDLPRTYLRFV